MDRQVISVEAPEARAPAAARLRSGGRAILALAALPLAFLAVLYVYPLTALLSQSVWDGGFTAKHYVQMLSTAMYVRVLAWTFEMAALTALLCLVIGYPVAYAMALASPRVRNLFLVLVILPFWTSSLVRAYAWIALLGRGGVVNTLLLDWGLVDQPLKLVFNAFGLYVGTVHIMLPYMILSLYTVLRGIDMGLVRAAQTLGASPGRAFMRIVLPLSVPGMAAGLLLVFMITLGFFITPAVLGGLSDETYVMWIEKLMNELMNWPLASALSALLLVVTLGLYWVLARYFGFQTLGGPDRSGTTIGMAVLSNRVVDVVDGWLGYARRLARRLRFSGKGLRRRRGGDPRAVNSRPRERHAAVASVAWIILAWMAVPIAIIVLVAFSPSYNLEFPPSRFSLQWFIKYFTRPEWLQATFTSARVALAVSVAATGLGVLAALALVRLSARWRAAFFALLLSPMIVPAVVFGVAAYFLFAKLGMVGTQAGMALAHTVLALAPAVVVIFAVLQGLDESLDRAAASLGASPWRRFRHVTLPLIAPGIVTAALLAFLTSFDEVVVAIFLSGAQAVTLPKKMYESVRFDTDPTITAASAVLVGLTLIVLVACELFRRVADARSRSGTAS